MKMLKPLKATLAACLIAAFASTAYANSHTEQGMKAYLKSDFKTALTHFKKAEQQGDLDAKFMLAGMYLQGQGVKQNERTALELLRKNCIAHHHTSCSMLADLIEQKCQAGNQAACEMLKKRNK